MIEGRSLRKRLTGALVALSAATGLILAPATAQVQTVDPNTQIDADLAPPPPPPPPPSSSGAPAEAPASTSAPDVTANAGQQAAAPATGPATGDVHPGYQEDDLIGAAEDVFGKGAKGLADIIRKTLKEQGEPIGYITGREVSGAIGIGLRYGSGTLVHKVEGKRDVYWTGPSLGFDLGGNAGSTFVLVYNLYDSQELYHRYPAGEGAAYFVGGFNASYLRWKKVVLIPIRLGLGVRLGANVGYMNFTEKRRWLPF
jgi:hypothetical protein